MSTTPETRASPKYVVAPDTAVETNGESSPFDLGALAGRPLLIVLRVTDIIEQESIHVSVWGSKDGNAWGEKPLFWFPQRFYRDVAPAMLDLRQDPDVKFLQARWEVNRWGRGTPRPYFKFGIEIEELTPE